MNVIAPWMVKAGISVMAILALGYVVLVQGARNVDANRGVRAAEGIELTSEQATDMTETANSVSALIEDAAIDVPSDLSLSTGATPTAQESEASAKSDAWYVRRIEDLMDRWGPRYTAAVDDIVKFEGIVSKRRKTGFTSTFSNRPSSLRVSTTLIYVLSCEIETVRNKRPTRGGWLRGAGSSPKRRRCAETSTI